MAFSTKYTAAAYAHIIFNFGIFEYRDHLQSRNPELQSLPTVDILVLAILIHVCQLIRYLFLQDKHTHTI